MRRKLLITFIFVALLLILDQLIKIEIKSSFSPGESKAIFGDWFLLHYIENPGMAFGTTLGNGVWPKLALSIFRLIAIILIAYYLFKQAKKGASLEFLMVFGLILAGATGNLLDSMFYDFFFPLNPCDSFNQVPGSGIKAMCTDYGFNYPVELRHKGFMLGSVVDMFQFNVNWPSWVPKFGGQPIFPAIWNLADASISVGVILILIRQRKYFPKKKKDATEHV